MPWHEGALGPPGRLAAGAGQEHAAVCVGQSDAAERGDEPWPRKGLSFSVETRVVGVS